MTERGAHPNRRLDLDYAGTADPGRNGCAHLTVRYPGGKTVIRYDVDPDSEDDDSDRLFAQCLLAAGSRPNPVEEESGRFAPTCQELRMNTWKAFIAAVLLPLALSSTPTHVAAQFGAGQRYVGAHVGLSGVGSAPAFGVNGEIAYNENIGIGAWLDTWSYGQTFTGLGGGDWNIRYVAIAGTGAWHFNVESVPKLDPFVGVGVGYFVVSNSWEGSGTIGSFSGSGSRIFVDGFAGVRYKLNENLSGDVRAGANASYLTVGIDIGV